MGHNPIVPVRLPTRMEALHRAYVKGGMGLAELEHAVTRLLEDGIEDERWSPGPGDIPPKPHYPPSNPSKRMTR